MADEYTMALKPGTLQTEAGSSQPRRFQERRQVTALFYDIVDSTALLARSDPEDFQDLQEQVHRTCRRCIEAHGGFLQHVLGDGGCAYFGFPDALEDAAERGVAAGLDIVAECQALTRPGAPLHVRVGIATGIVLVSGTTGQNEIVGLAPTLASRLQAIAAPDSVAVAEATWRLTRGLFDYVPLGAFVLKGLSESQNAWRPVAARNYVDRFNATHSAAAPLIGRDAELAVGLALWRRATLGGGHVLVLHGEPGIGKSRLLDELRRRVSVEGHSRTLQCSAQHIRTPFYPLLDHIRAELGGDVSSHRIDQYCAECGMATEDAATIAFLLGVTAPGPDALADRPAEILADRVASALLGVLERWLAGRPCLLAVEDLHWSDPTFLELLGRIVERIPAWPTLLVLTTRSDDAPVWLDRQPHVTRLTLAPLGIAETQRLVAALWEDDGPVPDGLAAFVHDRSDGVPLFTEELTRLVRETLGTASAGWRDALGSEGVLSLRDPLRARLDRLGPLKAVAQAASVIGRTFQLPLLARLVAGESTADSVQRALDDLVTARLLQQPSGSGGATYAFRHALMHEAAYASLTRSARRALHRRIIDLLAADPSLDPGLGSAGLAANCEQAGLAAEAVEHLLAAGRHAATRSAVREARALLEHALSLLDGIAEPARRTELELQCLGALGPMVIALEGPGTAAAQEIYERGIALCQALVDPDRERLFPIYWGWWFTAPEIATQQDRARTIVAAFRDDADEQVRLQAFHCWWASQFDLGRHADCLEAIDTGLALYREADSALHCTLYGGHDPKVCGLGEKGLSLWFLGATRDAIRHVRAARRWAERLDHLGSLCHALDIEAMLCRYMLRARAVQQVAARLATVGGEHGFQNLLAKSMIFEGWAVAKLGDSVAGRDLIARGLAIQRSIGTEEDFPIYVDMLAEALGWAGEPEAGLHLVAEAIDRAEATGHRTWLAELYRRKAVLHCATGGDRDMALADLDRSADIARDQGARSLLLRALLTRGSLDDAMRRKPAWRDEVAALLRAVERGPEAVAAGRMLDQPDSAFLAP